MASPATVRDQIRGYLANEIGNLHRELTQTEAEINTLRIKERKLRERLNEFEQELARHDYIGPALSLGNGTF